MSRSVRDRFYRLALTAASVVGLVSIGACALESQRGTEAGASGAASAPATGETASPSTGDGEAGPQPTPSPTSKPAPTSTRPAPTNKPTSAQQAGCPQGDRQREVEDYLGQLGGFGEVTVDGRQSAADCAAIKKFQQRYGIRPVEGRAGPTTADVARRLAGSRTEQCQGGAGTTVCVNLSLQTVWVVRDGTVVLAPTVTRTGMRGFRTPAGTFRINYRNIREWSDPYEVWMPYWQHFTDGMGFHETTTYIHDMSIGSHGCVNLLHADAVKLWGLAGVGTRVYLFGSRPGT